jgi:hypothetical protein
MVMFTCNKAGWVVRRVKRGKYSRGKSLRELPESDGGARESEISRDHRSPREDPETHNDFATANCLETFV